MLARQAILLGRGLEVTFQDNSPKAPDAWEHATYRMASGTQERADRMLQDFRENRHLYVSETGRPIGRIVMSGGQPRVFHGKAKASEGGLAAHYLVGQERDMAKVIEVEPWSTSTLSNFLYSRPLLHLPSITSENPLQVDVHGAHWPRSKMFGSLILDRPLALMETPGESDVHRSRQERIMGTFWKTWMAGVEPGNVQAAWRREEAFNAAVNLARPLVGLAVATGVLK